MKSLLQYINENFKGTLKGFSNYFETADDFIEALKTNNKYLRSIFKDVEKAKMFVQELYSYVDVPVSFKTTPLLFNVNKENVKIKRVYKKNTEIINCYEKYKDIFFKPYIFGDGSEYGQTKGNEFETKFEEFSKEYILSLINDNYIITSMTDSEITKIENLFNFITVDNLTLKEWIISNKDKILPAEFVKLSSKTNTRRNTGGRILKYYDNSIHVNFDELSNSGDIIADIQYILHTGDSINISLKDKEYQLSNIGLKRNNLYPYFDMPVDDPKNKGFKALCNYVGIDIYRIFNNVINRQNITDNDKIVIDSKYYTNIASLVILGLGSNYYIFNSTGDTYYVPKLNIDNVIISSATVEYPSKSRKRININITFSKNSLVTGTLQIAIRSKEKADTDEQNITTNYGFNNCQLIFGNVHIQIN